MSYDATGLVTRPAQRIILTANQALQKVDAADVRVSPAAAHTVTSSGNTIAVEFCRAAGLRPRLHRHGRGCPGAGTTCDVRPDGGDPHRQHRRARPGPRAGRREGPHRPALPRRRRRHDRLRGHRDQRVRPARPLAGGRERHGRQLLRRHRGAERRRAGRRRPPSSTSPCRRPRGGSRRSTSRTTGPRSGFEYADTSTGQSRNTGLYVVDMTGTHMPTAIAANGKPKTGAVPMTVGQWAYVPRTESALVRTGSDDLVLVDMSGRADPVRLGSATYLHGFVGTGTTAVVETGTGIERLDLTDGSKSALQAPAASTDAAVLGRIAQLSDDTYLRVLGDVRSDGTIAARIVRVDGGRASRLPVTIPEDASVTAVCPSPNSQFVAVATKSANGELVSIVDAASGALEASIDAGSVDWCGALPSGDEVG
ncbi:hypothetical protein Q9Q99_15250 [Curtobacterium flaccumfaciens]|nr:hypothetical protein Q9Q99_15250 [Curtobacterium flaccumfaciens]